MSLDAILARLHALPAWAGENAPVVERLLVGEDCLVTPPHRVHELLAAVSLDEVVCQDILFDLLVVDSVRLESASGNESMGCEVSVLYVLDSSLHDRTLIVATRLRTDPTTSGPIATAVSVSDLFASAAWLEREAHEQHGVAFSGHPALTRLHRGEGDAAHTRPAGQSPGGSTA